MLPSNYFNIPGIGHQNVPVSITADQAAFLAAQMQSQSQQAVFSINNNPPLQVSSLDQACLVSVNGELHYQVSLTNIPGSPVALVPVGNGIVNLDWLTMQITEGIQQQQQQQQQQLHLQQQQQQVHHQQYIPGPSQVPVYQSAGIPQMHHVPQPRHYLSPPNMGYVQPASSMAGFSHPHQYLQQQVMSPQQIRPKRPPRPRKTQSKSPQKSSVLLSPPQEQRPTALVVSTPDIVHQTALYLPPEPIPTTSVVISPDPVPTTEVRVVAPEVRDQIAPVPVPLQVFEDIPSTTMIEHISEPESARKEEVIQVHVKVEPDTEMLVDEVAVSPPTTAQEVEVVVKTEPEPMDVSEPESAIVVVESSESASAAPIVVVEESEPAVPAPFNFDEARDAIVAALVTSLGVQIEFEPVDEVPTAIAIKTDVSELYVNEDYRASPELALDDLTLEKLTHEALRFPDYISVNHLRYRKTTPKRRKIQRIQKPINYYNHKIKNGKVVKIPLFGKNCKMLDPFIGNMPKVDYEDFSALVNEVIIAIHKAIPEAIINGIGPTVHECGAANMLNYAYHPTTGEAVRCWFSFALSVLIGDRKNRVLLDPSPEELLKKLETAMASLIKLDSVNKVDAKLQRGCNKIQIELCNSNAKLSLLFCCPDSVKRTFFIRTYSRMDKRLIGLSYVFSLLIQNNPHLAGITNTVLCFLLISFLQLYNYVHVLHREIPEDMTEIDHFGLNDVDDKVLAGCTNKHLADVPVSKMAYQFAKHVIKTNFDLNAVDVTGETRRCTDFRRHPLVVLCPYSGTNLASCVTRHMMGQLKMDLKKFAKALRRNTVGKLFNKKLLDLALKQGQLPFHTSAGDEEDDEMEDQVKVEERPLEQACA